ncbi:MAG: beta-hydroxyacyl-ACP dehydratase [bacterium]|nr:beta-hydroxyacyl-ACP dehydratase [bacterium]
MKFELVDRVLEVVPGERIVTEKAVSRAEEYLSDHFPTFPVLPGVLMLETMTEAARWLAWVSGDFAHSMILLREAKNVTYKSFVTPGQVLRTEVTCRRMAQGGSEFSGTGRCQEREVVKARFALAHWNLADRRPEMAPVDRRLREQARARWSLLSSNR